MPANDMYVRRCGSEVNIIIPGTDDAIRGRIVQIKIVFSEVTYFVEWWNGRSLTREWFDTAALGSVDTRNVTRIGFNKT